MPRIYVASLSDYNNGILHGAWIDAAQDADNIRAEIAAMLRESKYPNVEVDCPKDGVLCPFGTFDDGTRSPCPMCGGTGKVPSAEEYAIHDYEDFEGISLGESEDLDRVAALASALEEHGGAFAAWYENGTASDDPTDWAEEFADAYAGEWNSLEAYAEELLDDMGTFQNMPDMLRNYFDMDAYARDLVLGGDVWTAKTPDFNVWVFRNI